MAYNLKVKASEVQRLLPLIPQLVHLELICLRGDLDLSALADHLPKLASLEIFYSSSVFISSAILLTLPGSDSFKCIKGMIPLQSFAV